MNEDYFVGCDALGAEDECVGADPFEAMGAMLPTSGVEAAATAAALAAAAQAQAAAVQGPFVTIHVKNVPELVKQQGGGAGAAAFSLLPQTIENTVYSKMAAEIGAGMKQKGVDADIKVVSNLPAFGGSPKDFLVGSVVGAAAVGLVLGIVKLIKRR